MATFKTAQVIKIAAVTRELEPETDFCGVIGGFVDDDDDPLGLADIGLSTMNSSCEVGRWGGRFFSPNHH